jgi:hypothetical protein
MPMPRDGEAVARQDDVHLGHEPHRELHRAGRDEQAAAGAGGRDDQALREELPHDAGA